MGSQRQPKLTLRPMERVNQAAQEGGQDLDGEELKDMEGEEVIQLEAVAEQ